MALVHDTMTLVTGVTLFGYCGETFMSVVLLCVIWRKHFEMSDLRTKWRKEVTVNEHLSCVVKRKNTKEKELMVFAHSQLCVCVCVW
jgi:hypothetical protein